MTPVNVNFLSYTFRSYVQNLDLALIHSLDKNWINGNRWTKREHRQDFIGFLKDAQFAP